MQNVKEELLTLISERERWYAKDKFDIQIFISEETMMHSYDDLKHKMIREEGKTKYVAMPEEERAKIPIQIMSRLKKQGRTGDLGIESFYMALLDRVIKALFEETQKQFNPEEVKEMNLIGKQLQKYLDMDYKSLNQQTNEEVISRLKILSKNNRFFMLDPELQYASLMCATYRALNVNELNSEQVEVYKNYFNTYKQFRHKYTHNREIW